MAPLYPDSVIFAPVQIWPRVQYNGAMDNGMRFPKNDSYVAGWEWAGDALTWMSREEVEDASQSAAVDLGCTSPDMAYEGIIDRVMSGAPRKGKK